MKNNNIRSIVWLCAETVLSKTGHLEAVKEEDDDKGNVDKTTITLRSGKKCRTKLVSGFSQFRIATVTDTSHQPAIGKMILPNVILSLHVRSVPVLVYGQCNLFTQYRIDYRASKYSDAICNAKESRLLRWHSKTRQVTFWLHEILSTHAVAY